MVPFALLVYLDLIYIFYFCILTKSTNYGFSGPYEDSLKESRSLVNLLLRRDFIFDGTSGGSLMFLHSLRNLRSRAEWYKNSSWSLSFLNQYPKSNSSFFFRSFFVIFERLSLSFGCQLLIGVMLLQDFYAGKQVWWGPDFKSLLLLC